MVEELADCNECGKQVEKWTLDRYGTCSACKAEERRTDMNSGDRHDK